ncbi:hypothetical protein [Nakamurella leprariae]|uniref:Uncharacterized protein n=1 Tax=Nakamurella leprariae TaxID=2803911 RepID=A0A938YB49_9ACTN|nr:hypothetical protein [Nakamurella leprariae]MBM9466356.1 hypothetical protein [Nakamurella leprariae]
MAAASDSFVVELLSRVDQIWAPVISVLGRSPESAPPGLRARWWADKVSTLAAGVSATPRFMGKAADLLPLQNTVGAAMQSLVVLGVAREHGLTGAEHRAERVSVLARVLLERELTAERVTELLRGGVAPYVDEALGKPEDRKGITGSVRALLSVAGLLGRIDDLLDARPKGRLPFRMLSALPVVGVVGGYAAEHGALRKAAVATRLALRGGVEADAGAAQPDGEDQAAG